ncbi:hypothetical protein HMPREF1548_01167 [Clostridium sp. KLE 1755]|nr:hypothetical protein HMPREF1548_01167 [Clostridium sp. KLE 1755]
MMVCCFRPCFYRKTKKQGEYIKSILWKFDNQELRCKGKKQPCIIKYMAAFWG